MSETVPIRVKRVASFIFWWGVTLVTLVLIDDLVFGPVFWMLSQVNAVMATATAFGVSLVFQLWVNWAGLQPEPGRTARFFINRLMAAHKRSQVVEREESVRRMIVSGASATAISLLVGGVLPIIFLHRRQMMDVGRLRRLAVLTSTIYAIEFALIHGGYGLGAVVGWMV